MTNITHDQAALACELLDCGACHTWPEALHLAAELLPELGRFGIAWDAAASDTAVLADDWVTVRAASPF